MKNIFRLELNTDRVFGLDLLRALAILFVVIGHGNLLLPAEVARVIDLFVFDGVSIFFVLSGFLIGGILIKIFEKDKVDKRTVVGFWVRRWFRTLPNYFLVLLVLGVLHLLFTNGFSFWDIKRYFVFAQNLFTPPPVFFFTESWSLSIEEWFYLLVPVVIFFLIKVLRCTVRQSVIITAILFILLVTGFRYLRYASIRVENMDIWDAMFRKQVATRLDSLMYGVTGAYLQFFHRDNWLKHKRAFLLAGIFLFILSKFIVPGLFFAGGVYHTVLSFTVISVATLFLLPFLSDLKKGQGAFYQTVTGISLVSYSMYLVHLSLVQGWIIEKINWAAFSGNVYLMVAVSYLLYWLITIPVSILLYRYFEIPCTRLRDHRRVKGWLG